MNAFEKPKGNGAPKKKLGKGWAALKKKKGGLARLAAFDRGKQKVHEVEHCEHLVDALSSVVLFERKKAVS